MKGHTVRKLRQRLVRLMPEHDSAVGLVHPYWARKPLNIVREIISHLCPTNGIVADPFMGSGTTIFAALSEQRSVIGSDLNPLSIFLVRTLLYLRDNPGAAADELEVFVDEFSEQIRPWFSIQGSDHLIDRIRYSVAGEFEDGLFELHPKTWVVRAGTHGPRRELIADEQSLRMPPTELLSHPVRFDEIALRKNSRIAIPGGALLGHFFCARNRAAINVALKLIASRRTSPVCRLLLSSALPLLRLSDKKASSQWPYWRPKEQLTSRNPEFIFRKRLAGLQKAASWLERNIVRNKGVSVDVFSSPAQEIGRHIPAGSVDLVLTDPPYADQVPYLEYSALWNELLGLGCRRTKFRKEIVVTDAPDRGADTKAYLGRLSLALAAAARVVRPNGYLVLFYQDHSLRHWATIAKALRQNEMQFSDLIPVAKQRRSMKSVVSPGKTLDGDLILVFQKGRADISSKKQEDARNDVPPIVKRYATFLRNGFVDGDLDKHLDDDRRVSALVG